MPEDQRDGLNYVCIVHNTGTEEHRAGGRPNHRSKGHLRYGEPLVGWVDVMTFIRLWHLSGASQIISKQVERG